jgi:D-sedoheptulose 7-phosphate isomerase
LAEIADEAMSVDARFTATVQELHLVGLHILCAGVDKALGVIPSETRIPAQTSMRAS